MNRLDMYRCTTSRTKKPRDKGPIGQEMGQAQAAWEGTN
jgi:hypothetical protein